MTPNLQADHKGVPELWRPSPSDRNLSASVLFASGVAACGGVAWPALPLLEVAPGSEIRPVKYAEFTFGIALVSFFTALCLTRYAWYGQRRTFAIVGSILCLLPWPLSMLILKCLAYSIGFRLED
ncbi:MAG: hypothetical protein JWR69_864 [Pedosphaera sp.]|nr:hypothetical protein [Pedosphaera sp.]